MAVKLDDYQLKAIDELRNGSILCGGVGSGKSRTALGYYLFKVCKGDIKVLKDPSDQNNNIISFNHERYKPMADPRDLYIITTAKKRDSLEWDKECGKFNIFKDEKLSHSGVRLIIDSWNNINKYINISDSFFIFDEQRVVGNGSWVKSFLNISKKNHWILLSATPGDQWSDYIPVFIANGFFKNRTDFNRQHCIFSSYTKFPKIERYIGEKRLEYLRSKILVQMDYKSSTIRHNEYIITEYDKNLYRTIMKDRWNPYENRPIETSGKLLYLIRRVCFEDLSRIEALNKIFKDKKCCIVFYNFNYELDMLRKYAEENNIIYKEWNKKKHQEIPKGEKWLYFVQYSAGSEGWNCITTDTVVLFSQNYSYRVLEQSCGRIDRKNTPFKDLYYYHFRSNSPIDIAIWRKLKDKKNFNEKSFIRRNKL